MDKYKPQTKELIQRAHKSMKTDKATFWRAVLKRVSRPRSRKINVNLSRISQYGKGDKIIVVPGKVLGSGRVEKKLRIAALGFSQTARIKVEQAGGECLTLTSLIEDKIKGKDVMIIG